MEQTNFMHSQSEIRVTKGNAVHFTRSRENNSIEELCILVSHIKDKQLVFFLFYVYHIQVVVIYMMYNRVLYMILILPRHYLIYDPDFSPSLSYI